MRLPSSYGPLARALRRLVVCGGLIVALAPSTGAAQAWNTPDALALVERAVARRADPAGAAGLAAWRATARGTLAFLGQFGDTALVPPLLVKASQIAVQVSWETPGISQQVVVGLRDTALVPGDIGYYRDRYGIVQGNFPDRIRLGEGRDVSDIVHPFSSAGLARYRFAVVDSQRLDTGRERLSVIRVAFRPRVADDALAVGAAYLDRASAELVRLELTFTPSAILDKRIEKLSVVLENGLVEGRYWLPRRQEVDVQRVATWLDVPARGIVRGRWEVGDYVVRAQRDTGAPAARRGAELVFASPESLAAYPFRTPVLDPARTDLLVAGADAVREVQRTAEAAMLRRLVPPQPRARASLPRLSDLVRVNRAEGVAVGAGVVARVAGTATVRVGGRYGLADERAKWQVALVAPLPWDLSLELRSARDLREAGDVAERSLVVNSLAAQEFAQDMTQPVWREQLAARLGLGRTLGLRWSLEVAREREAAVAIAARPVRGTFNPVVPAWRTDGSRLALAAEGAPWRVGDGSVTMRGEVRGARLDTDLGRREGLRAVAAVEWQHPVGTGRVVASSFAGVVGPGLRDIPQQQLWLGGPVSGPGYGFHAFSGRAGGFQRLEWKHDVPFVAVPLARYGRVPGRATLAPFVHATYIDGAPAFAERRQGWYPAAGLGAELFMGLVRVDVARGLRGGGWWAGIDVGRVFWGLL